MFRSNLDQLVSANVDDKFVGNFWGSPTLKHS